MNMNFNFKNFEPSNHLREYAKGRFGKIAKYVPNPENTDLQVNLEVEKFRHRADVVLTGDNLRLSANEESEDMYSTVDLLLDKLESQVRRLRDKNKKNRKKARGGRFDVISFSEESGFKGQSPTIVRSDRFSPKPMGVDEAAMQLDNLEDKFLVFLNAETERVNVIYHRKNGDFGLIDPGI
ncbi:ribosome hibernation-promoting factor, HPF/YfiA family [Desulfoplanes sp.]